MAYTTVLSFTDNIAVGATGIVVVYERDDTEDGGAGTAGRHRLKEDGVASAAAPAGRPCRSPHFMGVSIDPMETLGYGHPQNVPGVYRVVDVTPA